MTEHPSSDRLLRRAGIVGGTVAVAGAALTATVIAGVTHSAAADKAGSTTTTSTSTTTPSTSTTTPASSSGISVSNTSARRRSAMKSKMAIATMARFRTRRLSDQPPTPVRAVAPPTVRRKAAGLGFTVRSPYNKTGRNRGRYYSARGNRAGNVDVIDRLSVLCFAGTYGLALVA